ncbi:MAG TPA: TadE/TadG family type IV pilus assembly protein [Agromyces sp.]|nr:TadE/TadG family type IV pilus assembly protein [Agromyces sp.]
MNARRFGSRLHALAHDDRGSAVAEFTLVGILLTVLALAVVQLALALHVRNTVLDAAAEGARYAALAGSTDGDGIARTRDLIGAAISSDYARDISASRSTVAGVPVVALTVRATLPVIGLLGFERGLEVTGHAAVEHLE